MGGCYVGKGAGGLAVPSLGRRAFFHTGPPSPAAAAPRCSTRSGLDRALSGRVARLRSRRALRLIVAVGAVRLGMLCGNTYTPGAARRPLEAQAG